jgi:UDP-3-O-[3-hydroxymyristoyl] N-acetylglucosamine deacetylase/3-hydroxyacyl-[acyl-carrier-protein] dehydratase
MSATLEKTQKTIQTEFAISGIGLHTGNKVHIHFKPAPANSGISFIRVDLPSKPLIKAHPDYIYIQTNIPRCTTIGKDGVVIHTVEHLLSVLAGLEINNLTIEIDNNEVPGLDGSGIDFVKALKTSGIVDQNEPVKLFKVQEPIGVELNGSSIYAFPSSEFRVSYTLDYDHPFLRSQFFRSTIEPDMYESQLAPCRTFCLESEAKQLRDGGLGLGANYQNTLVVADKGVIQNTLRFPDEFVRHKVLDLIGDLYLLGMPIRGHIFAVKSGHTLNIQLLKKMIEQKERYEKKGIVVGYNIDGKREIDVQEILKILPHRYPFLLVDRVIEIEKGKRAIGIKNVTINDNFFQGHFPTRPIMPGVLMVEAMAQTAGVVVLTNEAHHGKVAFFMAVDKVKFRKTVVPGDQLIMEVVVVKDKTKTAQIHAVGKVNEEIVVEADMLFSFTDASFLNP